MQDRKPRMSARRKVLQDLVNQTRESIITCELEAKYIEHLLETDAELMSDDQKEFLAGELRFMNANIRTNVKKLEFYKKERNDLLSKNAMKDYHKYPESITVDA